MISPVTSSTAVPPASPPANRILVIDDDPTIRSLLQQALGLAGYAVVTAADGRQALRLYEEQEPACTITDLFMPEKEGLETIIELRRLSKTKPIIAMSGRFDLAEPHYLVIARALGANATLAKPFTLQELVTTVHQLAGPAAAQPSCRP